MSEETIGEVPEVPKRPRKTLIAILLIVIVGVAAVSVFAWWYTQKAPEEEEGPPTPSPEFNWYSKYSFWYSKYGFTFLYPEGMSISEQGMLESTATSSSGIVSGELSNDEYELITVGWLTTVSAPDLEISLNAGFEAMEAEGTDVDKGQLVTSTKAGHTMKYQYFTATAEGETMYGIFGVWYCDTNDRFYELILAYSEQDVLSKFQQYLDSFICH